MSSARKRVGTGGRHVGRGEGLALQRRVPLPAPRGSGPDGAPRPDQHPEGDGGGGGPRSDAAGGRLQPRRVALLRPSRVVRSPLAREGRRVPGPLLAPSAVALLGRRRLRLPARRLLPRPARHAHRTRPRRAGRMGDDGDPARRRRRGGRGLPCVRRLPPLRGRRPEALRPRARASPAADHGRLLRGDPQPELPRRDPHLLLLLPPRAALAPLGRLRDGLAPGLPAEHAPEGAVDVALPGAPGVGGADRAPLPLDPDAGPPASGDVRVELFHRRPGDREQQVEEAVQRTRSPRRAASARAG